MIKIILGSSALFLILVSAAFFCDSNALTCTSAFNALASEEIILKGFIICLFALIVMILFLTNTLVAVLKVQKKINFPFLRAVVICS